MSATWRRWAGWIRPHLEAIRSGDEQALLGSLERFVTSHRLLAPFAAALGGVAMLLAGLRLLIVNWRLTLVQIVPAIWIWVVMYDLRIHVIRDDSAFEVSGVALLPVGLAIVAITAACFSTPPSASPSPRAGRRGCARRSRRPAGACPRSSLGAAPSGSRSPSA